ncbi:uncharacterized protein LOC133515093 [Syngnathoides biaculeatus]|uniref:uncharacterized protein LOC133515093 n=1 Tax=Syngnathoides biaculeatus TaxID=300417 RepID=UPI002ADE40F9|nr:uncharacterized protein LOC133515093 [Syngnathoides biaculeatus]
MLPRIRRHLTSALARLPTRVDGGQRGASVQVCRHQHRNNNNDDDDDVPQPAAVKVLYDGLCPICVTEIRFLQFLQRTKPDRVEFVDISLPSYDRAKYNDVSFEAAMKEMHVIDRNRQVHRGVPAFAVMYDAAGLGWLGRFMTLPSVRPFMDTSYAFFARNRLKWTGRGEECAAGFCRKKTE